MTTITSTEQFASGRYVNYGSPSALDDLSVGTVIVYFKKTGTGGSNLGYLITKYTPGNGGFRFLVEHNSGSPRLVFGWDSSGLANSPSKTGTGGDVTDNTWQYGMATFTRSLLASDIDLYLNNVLCTPTGGATADGSGSLISDASNDLFLGNRGPSGTLGRQFDGDVAFVAVWNRKLDSTERGNVMTYGPKYVTSGLIFLFANDQDYSANAFSQTARSTRVTGSTPTNTALGDDTTAPVLTSPTGTQTGSTTGTGGATTDEANGTFYSVASTSSTAPSAAQVKAGQMHTGSAAAAAANTAVSSTGAKSVNFTGLSPSTTYYAHSMHEDAASNQSNVVTSASFTTTAGGGGSTAVAKITQLLRA